MRKEKKGDEEKYMGGTGEKKEGLERKKEGLERRKKGWRGREQGRKYGMHSGRLGRVWDEKGSEQKEGDKEKNTEAGKKEGCEDLGMQTGCLALYHLI